MVNELNLLEGKVTQVVALCRNLRAENIELRQSLAAVNTEKQRLTERINTARERLEALARVLPEAKDGTASPDV
jgi:cell division protein ZapB